MEDGTRVSKDVDVDVTDAAIEDEDVDAAQATLTGNGETADAVEEHVTGTDGTDAEDAGGVSTSDVAGAVAVGQVEEEKRIVGRGGAVGGKRGGCGKENRSVMNGRLV